MNKLNPSISVLDACCVTGNTKLWTVDGIKSFKELADTEEDVNVYCLDIDGKIRMSKMFHPRITGYNIEFLRITLADGTELNMTENHMVLTKEGYVMAGDLQEGDEIVKMKNVSDLPTEISETDKRFTEYEGTKKGTVIKRCEVTGEEFECVWEERELCTKTGYEADLFNMKKDVMTSSENYEYVEVKSVEFFGRENVYNGTVAVYHNYFTVDENTNTIINQMN